MWHAITFIVNIFPFKEKLSSQVLQCICQSNNNIKKTQSNNLFGTGSVYLVQEVSICLFLDLGFNYNLEFRQYRNVHIYKFAAILLSQQIKPSL